jgi:hypothetical protein
MSEAERTRRTWGLVAAWTLCILTVAAAPLMAGLPDALTAWEGSRTGRQGKARCPAWQEPETGDLSQVYRPPADRIGLTCTVCHFLLGPTPPAVGAFLPLLLGD